MLFLAYGQPGDLSMKWLTVRRTDFSSAVMLGFWVLVLVVSGCTTGRGAVVFAPTPAPPDVSPLPYAHPSGAFVIHIPRQWAVHEHHTDGLVSSYFTPPETRQAALGVAVVNMGEAAATDLTEIINTYQRDIRPDRAGYQEQERQVMGDGSWRLIGIRRSPGGIIEQVNTFVERAGTFISILDVSIPNDPVLYSTLETAINTLELNPGAPLQVENLAALGMVTTGDLQIVNVGDWTTPDGVYFITGEVINHTPNIISEIPIRVELQQADGAQVAGAVDTVMGYGIPPGGFAPFSLRFGQGQPQSAEHYLLILGDADWQPNIEHAAYVYGGDVMEWTDTLTIESDGSLSIDGTVTNISTQIVRAPMATVTVFDSRLRVIGARYELLTDKTMVPGEGLAFHLRIAELGGEPSSYFVNIQVFPEAH